MRSGLLIVLVLAVAGLVVWELFGGDAEPGVSEGAEAAAIEPVAPSQVEEIASLTAPESSVVASNAPGGNRAAVAGIDPQATDQVGATDRDLADLPLAVLEVVDAEERPIAGAAVDLLTVHFTGVESELVASALETGDDGRVEAAIDLDPDVRLMAQVVAAGFLPKLARLRWDGSGWSGRAVLDTGATVTGRIIAPDGQPISMGQILFSTRSGGDKRTFDYRVPVLTDGRFASSAPEAGSYEVSAKADGRGVSDAVQVEIVAGDTVDVGTLTLHPRARIAGRLVFPGGEGVPDVSVVARIEGEPLGKGATESAGQTDAEGAFELTELAPGSYVVATTGRHDTLADPTAGVVAPTEGLEIEVDAWMLRVRAVDADGATVAFRSIERGPADPQAAGFSLSTSNFASRDEWTTVIRRTGLLLRAEGLDGRRYGAIVEASLPAGRHSIDLTADDPRLARVRVRAGGRGIEADQRLNVSVWPVDGDGVGSSEKGAAGASEVVAAALLPGTYQLGLSIDPDAFELLEFDREPRALAAGAEEVFDVYVTRGGRVEFTLAVEGATAEELRAEGLRVACRYRLLESDEWQSAILVTESGTTISHHRTIVPSGETKLASVLTVGRYALELEGEGLEPFATTVDVLEGETTSLQGVLRRAP